jgi:hypothetical protein
MVSACSGTDTTSTVTANNPSISVGNCIDYEPYSDGIGWNGLAECNLPTDIKPSPSPPVVSGTPDITVMPVISGVYSCNNSISDNRWEMKLNVDGTGYRYNYLNTSTAAPYEQGYSVDLSWGQASATQVVINDNGGYVYNPVNKSITLGSNTVCYTIVEPQNVEKPLCTPDPDPARFRFGHNGTESCVIPLSNQLRGWPSRAPRHHDKPVYECSNGVGEPWYWVFQADGTLEDLKGNKTGSYRTAGSGIGITNQNLEYSQWQQVGRDLAISWGNCQAYSFGASGFDTESVIDPVVQVDADFMYNVTYTCGIEGESSIQQRTLDGFGRWNGELYTSGQPTQEVTGTYIIIEDRIWFDFPATIYSQGGYFDIEENGSLTPPYMSKRYCI